MDDHVSEPTPDPAAEPAEAVAEQDGSTELRQHLAGLDADRREEFLSELVRAEAETILSSPIALDSNFLEKGLNSLTALELAKTLIDRVGTEVPMVAIDPEQEAQNTIPAGMPPDTLTLELPIQRPPNVVVPVVELRLVDA